MIGKLQFFETIENSSSELNFPACPPAFLLTAIKASAPSFSTFFAFQSNLQEASHLRAFLASLAVVVPLEWKKGSLKHPKI